MANTRHAKLEQTLNAEEASLRERLRPALQAASSSGQDLFTNSQFNPNGLNLAHLPPVVEDLLEAANRCVALREDLGLPIENSVGQLYLLCCSESASSNPHRRGPKRLAAWLLTALNDA